MQSAQDLQVDASGQEQIHRHDGCRFGRPAEQEPEQMAVELSLERMTAPVALSVVRRKLQRHSRGQTHFRLERL